MMMMMIIIIIIIVLCCCRLKGTMVTSLCRMRCRILLRRRMVWATLKWKTFCRSTTWFWMMCSSIGCLQSVASRHCCYPDSTTSCRATWHSARPTEPSLTSGTTDSSYSLHATDTSPKSDTDSTSIRRWRTISWERGAVENASRSRTRRHSWSWWEFVERRMTLQTGRFRYSRWSSENTRWSFTTCGNWANCRTTCSRVDSISFWSRRFVRSFVHTWWFITCVVHLLFTFIQSQMDGENGRVTGL